MPAAPLRLQVTSDTANVAHVRREVEAYARAAGFDDAASAQIGLVVNEAIANVIRHAYQGQPGKPIELEAQPLTDDRKDGFSLQLRLRDWGNGVNPETAAKRGYVVGEPGGLGLVCLRGFMDSVEYSPQPDGGMLLTMVKRK